MYDISTPELQRLVAHRERPCITLYLPTPPKETPDQHRIGLKNLIRDAQRQLDAAGHKPAAIRNIFEPLDAPLFQQDTFWRYQQDGLVVFCSPTSFSLHALPFSPEPLAQVGSRFHLAPLLQLADQSRRFYVLAISLQHVRLLRCSLLDVSDLPFDEHTPRSLEEALGRDLTEEHLQWHTTQGTGVPGSFGLFHSQGEGIDDRKRDIWRFLILLDAGLRGMIGADTQAPIVLAGTDQILAAFRDVSQLKQLLPNALQGNWDRHTPQELFRAAWPTAREALNERERSDHRMLDRFADTERTAKNLEDVLTAALDGRIEALWLHQTAHVWGRIDADTRQLHIDPEPRADNEDLLDLAAISTFAAGGRVHLVDAPPLPPHDGPATALCRY